MAVPWTTGCRSTRPLEDVFVDLSGERPTSAGGAQYMKIVDDYSWMGWPYFLERKFSEAEVRRSGGFREVYGGCQRYWCPVDRGVRSLGQRNDVVRAAFMEVLGHRGIRREYIPVDSPKRNGVVGRYIAMTLETTMVSCLEAPRLFGDTRLP